MNTSDFRTSQGEFDFAGGGVNSSSMLHALALALGGGLIYLSLKNKRFANLPSPGDVIIEEQRPEPEKQPLEPLSNFNYAATPPIRFRPYKPKFHLTMAIQSMSPNDLILLDNSYRRRLAYRRHLLVSNPSETYGHLPNASYAVSEFYTYIFDSHLPTRFPCQFSKSPSGTLVQNHTTSNTYPIIPQSAPNALRALGENLDEDFVFLLPSDDGSWAVSAFVVCFPNGFGLGEKLGWKIGDVHAPVPEFKAKLGKSLERFLAKLRPGVENGVQRVNWGIAATDELFTPAGTHVYDGEVVGDDMNIRAEECVLRVERQTLWKLPGTGAVVFGIKTYTTPLSEIKAEDGEAERLAQAVEGLGDDMGRYKARGVWGKTVLDYLRN
ncbi:hypothetical protein BZA05DRAFT_381830 [Tricharina praecox]|uniref:uncharacterized protein n=1 Tax=Tricharina praecox TaxID=43433 RepID=UPI002220F140|nr:uncharacterized protein BZA05DRAFT_381830 [Tricharina praecox]KAI5858599.1 hypothetical protein BZA05DRAFT_381830 [Tricharina praecox]